MDQIYMDYLNENLDRVHKKLYDFVDNTVSNGESLCCPLCYALDYLYSEKNFMYMYALYKLWKNIEYSKNWDYLYDVLYEYDIRFGSGDNWEGLRDIFEERLEELKNRVKTITF